MKKWILASGLLFAISLNSFAQKHEEQRPTPEQRAAKMTEKMAGELQLTEDQKKEILNINIEYAMKRDAERQKRMADRNEQMEVRKAELKAQDGEIQEVLTEEQRSKWVEIKAENMKDRRRGRPKMQVEGSGDQIKSSNKL